MVTKGSAVTTINRPCAVVFAALTDVTRTGEWSPECVAGRWVPPATGPVVGAQFEGDNVAKLGPVPLKKWTTTSEVTHYKPQELFEYVSAEYTTWRFEFIAVDDTTRVTESFIHAPYQGFQKLLYDKILQRTPAMVSGMEETLARLKEVLEQDA